MSKKTRALIFSGVLVIGVVWLIWVSITGNSGVSNNVISFNVVDSTLTTVDVAVTKNPSATATCSLQALNESYAVVGYTNITIGPTGTGGGSVQTTTVRGDVRTNSLAVTGVVEDCWIVQ